MEAACKGKDEAIDNDTEDERLEGQALDLLYGCVRRAEIVRLRFSRRSFIYGCRLLAQYLYEAILIPSHILNPFFSFMKTNLQRPNESRFKVKSLYAFIEKMPFLALLIEFKITLLFKSTHTVYFIGSDDERLYVFIPTTSDSER